MSVVAKIDIDKKPDYKFKSACPEPVPYMHRFSESAVESWQNSGVHQSAFHARVKGSRTMTAYHYAEIISAYAQDLLLMKPEYKENTLYILELGAQSGFFAFKLLSRLDEIQADKRNMNIVYLISGETNQVLDVINKDPKLKLFMQNGRLDFIMAYSKGYFENGMVLRNKNACIDISKLKIPPVIIAVNYFGVLEQDLLHIHYGKLYEAYVSSTNKKNSDREAKRDPRNVNQGPYEMDISWELIPQTPYAATTLSSVMDYYMQRIDSSALLFPKGALLFISKLKKSFDKGFLLLAQDYGMSNKTDIRLHTAETLLFDEDVLLPLNSDALRIYCLLNRDHFYDLRTQERSISSSAMLFGRKISDFYNTAIILDKIKNHFNDSDLLRVKAALTVEFKGLNGDQMLSYLRLSHWDCGLLDIFMENIANQIHHFSPLERMNWIDGLTHLLAAYFPETQQPDYAFDIGFIATRLSAWALAIEAYQESLRCCGDEVICLTNLGFCYWQLGDTQTARKYLIRASRLNGATERIEMLAAEVFNWDVYCKQLDWYFPEYCSDEEIVLQPIGLHHAEAFFHQYRDPAIGELTRLPDFNEVADVIDWIKSQQQKNYPVFCIIHRKHGFSGCVAMIRSGEAAFFYFWIGVDYQGYGLGQRAGHLLLSQIKAKLGIQYVFTSTYECNLRSRNALQRLGFETLPFRAQDPDADMHFWVHQSVPSRLDRHMRTLSYKDSFNKLKSILKTCESSICLFECYDSVNCTND